MVFYKLELVSYKEKGEKRKKQNKHLKGLSCLLDQPIPALGQQSMELQIIIYPLFEGWYMLLL